MPDRPWLLSVPGSGRRPPDPRTLLTDYARHRGRISSTEATSLLNLSRNKARSLLEELEQAGVLRPGRPQRRGRGFFYVPAAPPPAG